MFSVLYLVGKTLVWQKGSFTLPACSLGSNLIFLHDSLSNTKFLQDFGALVSVFPHLSSKPSSSSVFSISVELSTADTLSVLCAGTREIPLCFGSSGFSWYFQLHPITVPILGADFLWHQHLLLDVASLLPCQQLEKFFLHPQNHQRSFMHHFLQPQAPFVIFLLSSRMFSPQMDLQQPLPSKEYAIIFKLSLALQCLANLRV